MSQLRPVKINAVTFPHHSFCLQVCHSWQLQQRCQDLVLNLLICLFFPLPVNWHEITAGDNRTEELSVRWERGGRKRGQGGVMCPSGYMSDSMRRALQSTLRLPQKWIHISSIAPLLAGQQKLSVLFMQSRGSRSGPFHLSLIFKFFIPLTILSCMAITEIYRYIDIYITEIYCYNENCNKRYIVSLVTMKIVTLNNENCYNEILAVVAFTCSQFWFPTERPRIQLSPVIWLEICRCQKQMWKHTLIIWWDFKAFWWAGLSYQKCKICFLLTPTC